jgi:phosphate transport system substrate-binding protein
MRTLSRRQGNCLALNVLPRRDLMIGAALTMLLAGASFPAEAHEPGRLRIGGTGMALAAMRQIADAYAATQSGVAIDVLPSLGTGGGLSAAAARAIDIALAARPLTDAERVKGLQGCAYARTPMAFVTSPATVADSITMSNVALIYRGSMATWPDGTVIRLIRREPSDADWAMLRNTSEAMAQAVEIALRRPGLLTVVTDQENGDALERLPGSFGAMSVGQSFAEARRLKHFALDGVMPAIEEMRSGRYPLSRTLYVVWHGEASSDVTKFLDYLKSDPAGALLTRLGHIPMSGTGA